ncbi:AP-1 complex subunit mu-2 [Larimichthys crocea]|uniref:Uncharacterized protein n=1 Tax=Larimichthys crocea TaxID=215358 RepID=A0ACD3RWK8_LARCR|nr:AP-1 complex subunit mu-2 [Larimichthys crocea]
MSASAIFVLDLKGKVLICRNYKGDVDMAEIDHFLPLLMQHEEEGLLCPVLSHGSVHFLWIKHSNLYLVATTNKNSNASLVYSFLYKLVEVFTEYFKELEEESIQDNFVVVYELLDELMDFGFPQTTDSKILQEYITQEGAKLEVAKSKVPTTVTNAVSWRSEGIKYKKNEVFIDVIESINVLVKPLIWIESVIEKFSHSRVEIMVKAKGQFKKQSVANNVEVRVPVPSDADSPKFKTSTGSAKYVPEKNLVVWTIKSFPVRYMKIIEKSGYQALPWVRYITQSGDYQLRTNV